MEAAADGAVPTCGLCGRAAVEARLNAQIDALIARFVMCCPYKERGCGHASAVGKDEALLRAHLEQCAFVPVPCPDCSEFVERAARAEHDTQRCSARLLECEHCQARVSRAEDALRAHRTHPTDPALPCANMRRCPNACGSSVPAPPSSSPPRAPSSSSNSSVDTPPRPAKRRREEDGQSGDAPDQEGGDCSSPPSGPTLIPHWHLAGHLLVCPRQPLSCALCSRTVLRSSLTEHFATAHAGHPLCVNPSLNGSDGVDDDGKERSGAPLPPPQAADSRAKDERLSQLQNDCIAAVARAQALQDDLAARTAAWGRQQSALQESVTAQHTARQADQVLIIGLQEDQQRLRAQLEQQRATTAQLQAQLTAMVRSQQAGSSAAAGPAAQAHGRSILSSSSSSRAFASPLPPPPPPAVSSSPSQSYASRVALFESVLGALLCTRCSLPRSLLSSAGAGRACLSQHPSERMLTMDGRYYCCGRAKGTVGCQPREMHEFDMDAVRAQFPEFADRCHNLRAAASPPMNSAASQGTQLQHQQQQTADHAMHM